MGPKTFSSEQYLVLGRAGVSCLKFSLGFELGQQAKPGPVLQRVSEGCPPGATVQHRSCLRNVSALVGQKAQHSGVGQRRPRDGSQSGKTVGIMGK